MHRPLLVGALGAGLLVVFSAGGPATGAGSPSPQSAAKSLLGSRAVLTSPARNALRMVANGDRVLGQGVTPAGAAPSTGGLAPAAAVPAAEPDASAPRNVRANNPEEDTHQLDQTTQSETSIAAAGRHVVVGFNDSQTTGLFLTAGSSLTGYAYSDDGGASFTDGGALPNPDGCANLGDPWLASDRGGAIYYSSLTMCINGLFVGVARSTDGGRTFRKLGVIPPPASGFYEADKDALTVGPDPVVKSRDNLYDTWDDFTFPATGALSGLPVARSSDGGQSWQVTYAAQVPLSAQCAGTTFFSSAQFIGAQPLVDPATGTLYVASEKISRPCPTNGGPQVEQRSEVLYTSTDGGQHFSKEVTIANITPSFASGALTLGAGRVMRNIEFPTLAVFGGSLFVTWNDGRSGQSHILISRSSNGGATWSAPASVTSGAQDELQPSISSDGNGLHVLYYQRNADNTLDVRLASSDDGSAFTSRRITNVSFSGVFTDPQFDPIIAFGYMGDYISGISTADGLLMAWGDNRDTVTNFLWPNGRNDPNVYFARLGEG